MFYLQLKHLIKLFHKNGYPGNFTDRCFKLFLNRVHILKEKVLVEKEPSRLARPYLGATSLLTGTKLQKVNQRST